MHKLTGEVRSLAQQLGVDYLAIVPPGPLVAHIDEIKKYPPNRHYLIERADPRRLLPTVRTIILLGTNVLRRHSEDHKGGGLSGSVGRRYLYYRVNEELALEVAAFLKGQDYAAVTTEDVPVKYLLARAGEGTYGKNGLLYVKPFGSWLNTWWGVLTDAPLETLPLNKELTSHCGDCQRCMKACPTGAIIAPYKVDDRLCRTRHNRGLDVIAPDQRGTMGEWIYGCDLCQEVCPANREVQPAVTSLPIGALPYKGWSLPDDISRQPVLVDQLDHSHSPYYLRNVLVALGNRGGPGEAKMVEKFVAETTDPDLQEYGQWALAQIMGRCERLQP